MIIVIEYDTIKKKGKRDLMEFDNKKSEANEIDRDALIAYMYDVYSIEQAIHATTQNIYKLNEKKRQLRDDETYTINALSQRYDAEISKESTKFKDIPYDDNDIKFKERKKTIIASCAWIIFLIISVIILSNSKTNSDFAYELLVPALLISLLAILFIAMAEANSIAKLHRLKVDKKNKGNKNKIDKQINVLQNDKENDIFTTQEEFQEKVDEIDDLIIKQKEQQEEFEKIRFNLYNDMLLIPKPHQNLKSACYIYDYLITSKVTDLNYIFTQLYLQKIENKLDEVIELQKKIIINQNLILAELQKQTQILTNINNNISSFKLAFEEKMNELRGDLGEIADNQRAMLNNQAVMYNAYMKNALKCAKSDEEKNEYLRMIANNTQVSAMFERADFLGLEMDRNWTGDY